jgi:hypothetical protein
MILFKKKISIIGFLDFQNPHLYRLVRLLVLNATFKNVLRNVTLIVIALTCARYSTVFEAMTVTIAPPMPSNTTRKLCYFCRYTNVCNPIILFGNLIKNRSYIAYVLWYAEDKAWVQHMRGKRCNFRCNYKLDRLLDAELRVKLKDVSTAI